MQPPSGQTLILTLLSITHIVTATETHLLSPYKVHEWQKNVVGQSQTVGLRSQLATF